MNKGRIIYVLVLLTVFGCFGAVYQFYFKEKLEAYSRDQDLLTSLDRTYAELEETFSGYQPEQLTEAWRAQRPTWQQAVTQRAAYFHAGDWYSPPQPPEDVPILRFWYGEQANQLVMDAIEDLYTTMGPNTFPMDLYGVLGVARAEQWAGLNVPRGQVINNLGRLTFGISAFEMLADAGATMISQVVLWPFNEKEEHAGLLSSRTIAFSFAMSMENLVKFLEELRQMEQYWTVDGLKIDYPYLAYDTEPQLQVQMLLTHAQAVLRPDLLAPAAPAAGGTAVAAGGTAATAPGASAQAVFQMQGLDLGRGRALVVQEPGPFGKAWKWFKRYVLYTN